MLVQSGRPSLDEDDQQDSNGLLDEDEDSYGIVPIKKVIKPVPVPVKKDLLDSDKRVNQNEPMVMRNESFLNIGDDSVADIETIPESEPFEEVEPIAEVKQTEKVEPFAEVEQQEVSELLDLDSKPKEDGLPISNSLLSSIFT